MIAKHQVEYTMFYLKLAQNYKYCIRNKGERIIKHVNSILSFQ